MIEILALAITFVTFGGHVFGPWELARREPDERRSWTLLAIPLLLAAIMFAALQTAARPDALIAAGWGTYRPTDAAVRALMVCLPILLLIDLTLLAGWRKLEPLGWRLAAAFGAITCLAVAVFQELLRSGEGPWTSLSDLAIASLARCSWMIAAGEILFSRRPRWALAGAVAVPLYFTALPSAIAEALLREGWWLSAAAAALLLAGARWLPERLRRPAAGAGLVLLILLLSRAAQLAWQTAPATTPLTLPGV
ncbi:MAG: hypothetical protein AAF604_12635 [Acidobacteriota bacterium]